MLCFRPGTVFWGKVMAADDIVPMPGNGADAAKLAALGMISGALSWTLIDFSDQMGLNFQLEGLGVMLWPISVFPGLVFGLVFGAVLHLRARASWLRAIGYVFAAGLGYVSAFHVAFYIIANGFNSRESPLVYIVGGVPAGLAGSLLSGLLTKTLLGRPGRAVLRRSVIIGTTGGVLLGLASFDSQNGWGFLAFFVLWQGAYAASLAPMFRPEAGSSTK